MKHPLSLLSMSSIIHACALLNTQTIIKSVTVQLLTKIKIAEIRRKHEVMSPGLDMMQHQQLSAAVEWMNSFKFMQNLFICSFL